MADTASFSAAMKTKFIGPIRDGLWQGKVLLFGSSDNNKSQDANPTDFKGILPMSENIDFVGNDWRIPLLVGRNQAVGFRSENDTLPAPGASEYTYITEPMRYAYASFNITGQLLEASRSNEGAFKSAFKQEMAGTVLSSKLDFNRAAYGDGSGKLFDVRTNASSGDTDVDVSSTVNIRGGEYVDFVTSGGTVVSAAHKITVTDRPNRNLTFSPALGAALTAGTHFAVRASSDSTTSVPNNSQNKEIQGLASIVGTSTLHGVNPTTYPIWKSIVRSSVGGISDDAIRKALNAVRFENGMDLQTHAGFILLTTTGIRDRYAATLTSVKRFNDASATTLRGGFQVLLFNGMPIFTDDQCPTGTMYGLSTKEMFWAQMGDWDWMDRDGSILKHEPRKDRYIAYLKAYKQLGTTQRNAHFVMTGITDEVY